MSSVVRNGTLRWVFSASVTVLGAMGLGGCQGAGSGQIEERPDALTPGIFLEEPSRALAPANLRDVSKPGIDVLKLSEGFRSHRYHDSAGYCTIAYGHLIKKAKCDGTEPREFLDGLTERAGEVLLRKDLIGVRLAVAELAEVELTDAQFAALCNFAYNVGTGNLERSTLLKRINAEEFEQVPTELRRWVLAGGQVVDGLKARREREIKLFFDGAEVPEARDLSPPGPVDIRIGEQAPG